MTLTDQVQVISSVVQAISAVLLTVVTIVYVVITQRILQVPHQSLIKPIGKDYEKEDWTIKIHNFGPGMAVNVEVKTILSNSNYEANLTGVELYRTERLVVADGNHELAASQDGYYYFNSNEFIRFLAYPLVIQWETITGKKKKTVSWLYTGGPREDYFLKLDFRKRVKLEIRLWKLYFRTLYGYK